MFSLKKLDCALDESVLTCFQQSHGLQTHQICSLPLTFPKALLIRGDFALETVHFQTVTVLSTRAEFQEALSGQLRKHTLGC